MRYVFADCFFDTERYAFYRGEKRVPLRPKVFHVLTYFLQHRDRVVTKHELFDQAWAGQIVGDTTLHACIMSVRKTIGDRGPDYRLLRTVYGRGYHFIAPVEELVADAEVGTPPTSSNPPSSQRRSVGNRCTIVPIRPQQRRDALPKFVGGTPFAACPMPNTRPGGAKPWRHPWSQCHWAGATYTRGTLTWGRSCGREFPCDTVAEIEEPA